MTDESKQARLVRRPLPVLAATALLAAVLVVVAAPPASAATFTVNTTDDHLDGTCDTTDCSLRDAIDAADTNPGDDTVALAAGAEYILSVCDPAPFADTPAVNDLDHPSADLLTIAGNGATIRNGCVDSDAGADSRIIEYGLDVLPDAAAGLTLTGLTIADGHVRASVSESSGAGGGAVLANGDVTSTDTDFVNNRATGGPGGSALGGDDGGEAGGGAIGAAGSVVVDGGSFLGNVAEAGPSDIDGASGGEAYGGAIATVATPSPGPRDVTLTDVVFDGNRAEGGHGTQDTLGDEVSGGGARGGAVSAAGTITIAGSTFDTNEVVAGSSDPATVEGGNAVGGAVLAWTGLTVTESTFETNAATSPGDLAGGGAISVEGVGADLVVTDSTFRANSTNGAAGLGGALHDDLEPASPSRWVIEGSTFVDNVAAGTHQAGGGAVWGDSSDARNSTFDGNLADGPDGSGHAIFGAGSLSFVTIVHGSGPTAFAVVDPSDDAALLGTVIDSGDAPACASAVDPVLKGAPNWIDDSTCGFPAAPGGDPILGPLGDNGGPTETRVPGTGSPLLDAAGDITGGCPGLDQRGEPRPSGPACDIGAVELQVVDPGPGPGPGPAPDPDPEPDPDPTPSPRSIDDSCPADVVEDAGYADVDETNLHHVAIDCISSLWAIAEGRPGPEALAAGDAGDPSYAPAEPVGRGQMASFIARLTVSAGGSLPVEPADAFPDDDDSVHELAIDQLAGVDVIQGRADGSFGTLDPVRRDQMATFLANAYAYLTGEPLVEDSDYFTDDDTSVHEAAINVLAGKGIAGGFGDGSYGPAESVRRDQMASFIARLLDLLVEEGHTPRPT